VVETGPLGYEDSPEILDRSRFPVVEVELTETLVPACAGFSSIS